MRPASASIGPGGKKYKLVLLGDSGVGKSSLVVRLCKNEYIASQHSTVGASFFRYTAMLEGGTATRSAGSIDSPDTTAAVVEPPQAVHFDIWDTAGQERYKSLASMYYRGAAAVLVVFDITSYETYERAKQWVRELGSHSADAVVTLVGNKADLAEARAVPVAEASAFAKESGVAYAEASAKEGTAVKSVFHDIAARLVRSTSAPVVRVGGVINVAGGRARAESMRARADSVASPPPKKGCDC